MFCRFSRTPACDGRTDRRTDRHRAMSSTADAQHRAVKTKDVYLFAVTFNSEVLNVVESLAQHMLN